MLFGRNFCEKRQICVSESDFGEVRGDARLCVGKRMANFLLAFVEHSSLSTMVPKLKSEMCTARRFLQGARPLCTQILPGQGRPSSHS